MFSDLLQRLVRRPAVAAVTGSSAWRSEVCPPALFAGEGRGWRAWLARTPMDRAIDRLAAVKGEFCAQLDDLRSREAHFAMVRIGAARSLRELWHLRADVFNMVACHHSQEEAERRLALLNRHFPTRSPRSQFANL